MKNFASKFLLSVILSLLTGFAWADVDIDDDGLIEISSLAMLDNVRNNLAGAAYNDGTGDDSTGCAPGGCFGYELTQNLDFDTNGDGVMNSSDTYWDGGDGWSPIGGSFSGTFEGNGHQILNLYIDVNSSKEGLFNQTTSAALIKNLNFAGPLTYVSGITNVGSLVGHNSGTVDSVSFSGTVDGSRDVGGIIGFNRGDVRNLKASGVVHASTRYAGGLVGRNVGGQIEFSLANATVTGSDSGGAVGYNRSGGNVTSSVYGNGDLNSTGVGRNTAIDSSLPRTTSQLQCSTAPDQNCNGLLTYSGWDSSIWDFGASTDYPQLSSAASGPTDDDDGDGYTNGDELDNGSDPLDASSTPPDNDNDFVSDLTDSDDDNDGYSDIDESANGTDPLDNNSFPAIDTDNDYSSDLVDIDTDGDGLIEISSLAMLDDIRNNLSGAAYNNGTGDDSTGCGNGTTITTCSGYELTQDLDFDTNGDGAIDALDDYWNGGLGWEPISNSSNTFKTVLEGNHYRIGNLFINRPSQDYTALIGHLDSLGAVRNLGLVEVSVVGKDLAGAFAGRANGLILNSYMSGQISGEDRVGGIAGSTGGVINSSYALSDVTGSIMVGGLTGSIGGDVINSYSMGTVAGQDRVGGLIGWVSTGSSGFVENSYTSAIVVGPANTGAFIGLYQTGVLTAANYYDSDKSGALPAVGSDPLNTDVDGYSRAQLECPTAPASTTCAAATIYDAWDGAVWDFGTNSQYPVLTISGVVHRDTDGDWIFDGSDLDDDNDGVLDTQDAFPFDELEAVDTDADGMGNNADTDDDNDGYTDIDELAAGSNPLDSSSVPPTSGPPSAVQNAQWMYDETINKFVVSWDPPPEAVTGYYVQYWIASADISDESEDNPELYGYEVGIGDSSYEDASDILSASVTEIILSAGSIQDEGYGLSGYVKIRAFNAQGDGPDVYVNNIERPVAPPSPPSNLTYQILTNEQVASFSWDAPSIAYAPANAELYYEVRYQADNGVTLGVTNYTSDFSALDLRNDYYWDVTVKSCIYDDICGDPSTIRATLPTPSAPAEVINLRGSYSEQDGEVTFRWTPPPGAQEYELDVSGDFPLDGPGRPTESDDVEQANNVPGTTSFRTYSSPGINEIWFFRITPKNQAGLGPRTVYRYDMFREYAPTTLPTISSSIIDGNIEITATVNDNDVSYLQFNYESQNFNQGDKLWGKNHTYSRPLSDQPTRYEARACNSEGCGAWQTHSLNPTGVELNFESGLENWINTSSFLLRSGRTPTSWTGPSGARDGSSYIYMETSSGHANEAGHTETLTSPEFTLEHATLSFYYHMFGSNMGTLYVETQEQGSTNWDTIWSISGQQHATYSFWSKAQVSLGISDSPRKVRFRGVAVGGDLGDMALDDIGLVDSIFNEFDLIGTDPANDVMTEPVYYGQLSGAHSVGADGSFSYQVPIEVPPGINGMQPNISLNYNSNRRNGSVGWGWSIGGVSAITRCSASLVRDGEMSGVNSGDDYKFCIDGQRLVEVSSGEYRTEVESFRRIKRVNGTAAVPDYWTIENRDGGVYTFGGVNSSEQLDGEGDAMSWYITQQKDIAGNYVDFYYETTSSGMHRIEHIEYTKNASAQNTDNRIEFGYETRNDDLIHFSAGAKRTTDERLAQILVKAEGNVVREYDLDYQVDGQNYNGKLYDDPVQISRLASLKLCYGTGNECAGELSFDWTEHDFSEYANSQALSLEYAGQTFDYDSYYDQQLATLWNIAESQLNIGEARHGTESSQADFDGDFLPDYFVNIKRGLRHSDYGTGVGSHEIYAVLSSTGQRVLVDNNSQTCSVYADANAYHYCYEQVKAQDINGDGLDDLLVMWNSPDPTLPLTRVYLSTGSGFQRATAYEIASTDLVSFDITYVYSSGNTSNSKKKTNRYSFVDMNGDGLVDVVREAVRLIGTQTNIIGVSSDKFGLAIAYNNGSGLDSFINVALDDGTTIDYPLMEYSGDVNGDDLIDFSLPDGDVYLNNGDHFVLEDWGANMNTGISGATYSLARADMNGDGLLDILRRYVEAESTNQSGFTTRLEVIVVNLSTGSSWAAPKEWGKIYRLNTSFVSHYRKPFFRDYNRDGKTDMLHCHHPSSSPATGWVSDCRVQFSLGDATATTSQDGFSPDYVSLPTIFAEDAYRMEFSQAYAHNLDLNADEGIKPRLIQAFDQANGTSVQVTHIALADGSHYQQGTTSNISESLVTNQHGRSLIDSIEESSTSVATYMPGRYSLGSNYTVSLVEEINDTGVFKSSAHEYADMRVHRSGYGNLGFAETTQAIKYSDQTESLRTEAEHHQYVDDANSDHDFRLVGAIKRQVSCVVDSLSDPCVESGINFNLLSDSANQWKVRIYDDDIDSGFDSPHFFPYQYRSTTTSWDLEGTKISDARTQMDNAGAFSCSSLSSAEMNAILTTTSTTTDYSSYGVPLYSRNTLCDESGTAQDVTAQATENLDITDFTGTDRWVVGLVGRVDSKAYVANSLANIPASLASRRTDYDYHLSDSGNNKAGMLSAEIVEPGNTSLSVASTFTYNAYGSVSSIAESWSGGSRTTGINETYAANGERTVVLTNPLLQRKTTIYEADFGLPRRITDVNNLATNTTYDAVGRVDTITYADGTTSQQDYRRCDDCFVGINTSWNRYEHWYLQTKSTGSAAKRTYFDVLDREVGTKTYGLDGTIVYTEQKYSAQGLVANWHEPTYKTFRYDVLGRRIHTLDADGTGWNYEYDGLSQSKWRHDWYGIDTNNTTESQLANGAGWVMRSTDAAGTPVDFTYTPWGDLESTRVNNDAATDVSIQYDILGRKTQLDDPNTGVINYFYDPLGRLDYEVNARGQETDYNYDLLDRQIERIDDATASNSAVRTHLWVYDTASGKGKGQLHTLTGFNTDGTSFLETYTYDDLGRPVEVVTDIDGSSYTTETVYDNFSRPAGIVYPTGYGTRNNYNSYGHLQEVENAEVGNHSTLWFGNTSDSAGNLKQFTLGNGVVTDLYYNGNYLNRLSSIRAYKGSFSVHSQSYRYDIRGRLDQRRNNPLGPQGGGYLTEFYIYDDVNRLIERTFGSFHNGNPPIEYFYDALGNITSRDDVGTYNYNGSSGPNAVDSVGSVNYTYDASGNLIASSDGSVVEYTSYNKPTSIIKEGNSSTMVYGPHQSRVKRVDSSGRTTIYGSLGVYEEVTYAGATEQIHYLNDFGVYVTQIGSAATGYYLYHHRDHLGSIVAKSDEIATSAANVEWLVYDPWGEKLVGSWEGAVESNSYLPLGVARGFTDHEHLDGVGLIHMNGRVYDPTLGRFMSPDPFVQAPYNTQSYNRYSYVLNNPLTFTDPSGYQTCITGDEESTTSVNCGGVGGVLGGIASFLWASPPSDHIGAYDASQAEELRGSVEGSIPGYQYLEANNLQAAASGAEAITETIPIATVIKVARGGVSLANALSSSGKKLAQNVSSSDLAHLSTAAKSAPRTWNEFQASLKGSGLDLNKVVQLWNTYKSIGGQTFGSVARPGVVAYRVNVMKVINAGAEGTKGFVSVTGGAGFFVGLQGEPQPMEINSAPILIPYRIGEAAGTAVSIMADAFGN